MDFWKAILGLARRKLIVIPLLVSAIAAALTGYFVTPLHYVSSTTMVLVTPAVGGTLSQDPTVPTDLTNPMLSFSNDLKTASSILIQVMNTPEVAAELGAVEGGPTQLTVDDGRTNPNLLDGNGPFVYVAGESTSATEAKDVVVRAQKRIRQELLDRQRSLGAPPQTYLTMVDVVAPTTPKVTRSVRIKVGGIALVLSFVCGLSVAYAWQARRYRRAAAEPPPKHQDIGLDESPDWDRHDLNEAAEESSGDRPLDIAEAALGDGERWTDEGKPHAESPVSAEPRPADGEQIADGEQMVSTAKPVADEHAAETEPSPEPEEVAYRTQTGEGWDLYIVDYPPANWEASAGARDGGFEWNWDWAIDSLESEQDSAVVGRHQGG